MKDIYIQFSGKYDVKGESRDNDHKDWLEANAWTHEITQPKSASTSSAGGHTAERCEHGNMVFQKDVDLTSPRLWEACSAGYTFDEVTIDFMRADGEKRVKYLEVKLKNALVASVAPSITDAGHKESIELTYAAVQWTYTQQDVKGGSKGNKVGKWSLSKNTASYDA